ncbi:TPA: GrpB family protein [Legionella pneumophila]|nr:hypothetical protein [Legionella pneumophila subsp. pneumophila]HAU0786469.1 GrpB family protein [Legionella pneumophila]HAU0811902.1 GrpB family protein [Legionella pneumophila]HAU0907751.1 GrpB family protein [Legionella pneumophila]HAU0937510.1 GrpB family protein [Legionella pneumophila]
MIELSCYKNEWKTIFNDFRVEVLHLAKGLVLDVQHIGSTSIAGVKAKDIIDTQIAIKSFDQMGLLKPILESLGFNCIDTIPQDHVPFHDFDYVEPGWEKRLFKGKYKEQNFNIHIRVYNSLNWKFALNFKNYLSENELARYAFMQFKERLALADVSIEEYCMIKDSVIDLLSLQFRD